MANEVKKLTTEQAAILAGLQTLGGNLVTAFAAASLPKQALYRFTVELSGQFRASLKARTADPVARKKTRIQDRIAALQAELAGLGPKA